MPRLCAFGCVPSGKGKGIREIQENLRYDALDLGISADKEHSTTMNSGKDSNDNNSDRSDIVCTDVEYLDDAASDITNDADDYTKDDDQYPYSKQEKTAEEAPRKVIFEKDITLTLDDIDYLFLSYAQTFRSLAKQFQTMLKLDIAKLFSRYEMKNISLSTEEPVKHPPEPVKTMHISEPLIVKPPSQADKPSLDRHTATVVIPSKEENKKIFKRVPLQAVISGMHKPEPVQSNKVIQISQRSFQVSTQRPPEVIRYSPQVANKPQLITQPQKTQSKGLEINTTQQCYLFESLPRKAEPTVTLERLKMNIPIQSSTPPELTPPTPPKMMKYYVPKKGPAYAIVSKEELQKTKEGTPEPDLEMEVFSPETTETVFVTTDNASFSEDET